MGVVPHAELAVDRGYRVVEAPVAGAIFLDHQVLVTVAPAGTAATTLRLSSLRGISLNTWQSPSLNPAFGIGAVRCRCWASVSARSAVPVAERSMKWVLTSGYRAQLDVAQRPLAPLRTASYTVAAHV